ncbi:YHYH domain-containing protein [Brevibacillus sp. NRS-1366]|uniref:YHYH domain-containing protein n=1 Tax=Brevibacillus sp. NRS-1366 TaxID=3233899 RepID=UPI003D2216B4
MKKITSFLALMLLLFFLPMQMIEAHPGRTDANGGHTCRTNCEKWGLQYGQYHYHNGGGSSSGSKSTTSTPAPKKPSTPKAQPQVVLPKKTIVAVDNTNVYSNPSADSTVTATLWYGFELKDTGNLPDFVTLDQGYVSRNLLFTYSSITPKAVKIHAEKGYFFSTASSESIGRGYALKDTLVQVVGESGDWYYGSTKDANGNVLVGFVSKSVAY